MTLSNNNVTVALEATNTTAPRWQYSGTITDDEGNVVAQWYDKGITDTRAIVKGYLSLLKGY